MKLWNLQGLGIIFKGMKSIANDIFLIWCKLLLTSKGSNGYIILTIKVKYLKLRETQDEESRITLANQEENLKELDTLSVYWHIHRVYLLLVIKYILLVVIFLRIGYVWLVEELTIQIQLRSNAYVGTPRVVESTRSSHDYKIVV